MRYLQQPVLIEVLLTGELRDQVHLELIKCTVAERHNDRSVVRIKAQDEALSFCRQLHISNALQPDFVKLNKQCEHNGYVNIRFNPGLVLERKKGATAGQKGVITDQFLFLTLKYGRKVRSIWRERMWGMGGGEGPSNGTWLKRALVV